MFYGVFFVDLAYSLQLVAKVRAFAKEHEVLIRYEMLRQQIRDNAEERKEKIHWFFSLKSVSGCVGATSSVSSRKMSSRDFSAWVISKIGSFASASA